jgi:SAM-dependent methyltransferase
VSHTSDVRQYKKDFWSREHQKFVRPHYRLQKAARLVNRMASSTECALLDVGCGPATLARLLRPNISYYGIDISIKDQAPNLLEVDILEAPIKFGDRQFDIVLAQGLFEYMGDQQSQKFSEIADLLTENGTFVVSYINFDHHKPEIYEAYSNVQSFHAFRRSLEQRFVICRVFPSSHNWNHGQPNRRLVKAANMYFNFNVPVLSPRLAVEYFFVCSPRKSLKEAS